MLNENSGGYEKGAGAALPPAGRLSAGDWFALMVTGYHFRVPAFVEDPLTEIRDPIGRAGFETFIPRMKIEIRATARRGGAGRGRQRVIVPALPGYIFVRMDGGAGAWSALADVRAGINPVRVVRGVVGVDGVPAPLRRDDLLRFQDRADADIYRPESPCERLDLRRGDKVRVVSGPFVGMDLMIDASAGTSARALVLVFNRETLSTIPLDALKKIA